MPESGAEINRLIEAAKQAQARLAELSQEQVDAIVRAMALAGIDKHMELARMAAEETQTGGYEDLAIQNLLATEHLYHDIKYVKTVGIVNENYEDGYIEVAEPLGIIACISPIANPTAAVMIKSLTALKTRNAIVFSFHPRAQRSSAAAAKVMHDAAVSAGAPAGCIGWIETPTAEATNALMTHPDVALILSETADHGLIRVSDHAIVCRRANLDQVLATLQAQGAYILSPEETVRLEAAVTDASRRAAHPDAVGQPAAKVAAMAGITVPPETKLLVARLEGVGPEYPLCRARLASVLCLHVVDHDEADRSRGDTPYRPAASVLNLLNIRRINVRQDPMKWFRVPSRIYFEPGSLGYLGKLHGTRAFIVTEGTMVKLGYVATAMYHLERRGIKAEVFSEVEPDPSVDTVMKGVEAMNRFQPDVIIALGGGSPIDAAKAMWLMYEHPEVSFDGLRLKFMDHRKRIFKFPRLGMKATFVAIPTTSGTGSEVSAFAVITDKRRDIKYPLADYELTPDIAIVDPELVYTLPKGVTADTGIDVLTHAIEAYVSAMASDYTDALAAKAIELVFKYLPAAYENGSDKLAREKMHNASTIAGLAFTNAFLGINHSLAHVIGAKFGVPHGRANAVLMPHVIAYNATEPANPGAYPEYDRYRAPERYAEIARLLGLPAETPEQGVASLIEAIRVLMDRLNLPRSFAECGIDRAAFEREVPAMAEIAFADQCTLTNPRLPRVSDLEAILRAAYGAQDGGGAAD